MSDCDVSKMEEYMAMPEENRSPKYNNGDEVDFRYNGYEVINAKISGEPYGEKGDWFYPCNFQYITDSNRYWDQAFAFIKEQDITLL